MLLNLEFRLEVSDGRLVVPALLVATTLDAGVDKVLDPVLDGFVDQIVALSDFAVGGHALAHADLYRVDAPDGLRGLFLGFGEDGGDVVEVALDKLDGVGFGSEFLAAGGGGVAGYGEDGVGGGAGEERGDDCTALFASGLEDL